AILSQALCLCEGLGLERSIPRSQMREPSALPAHPQFVVQAGNRIDNVPIQTAFAYASDFPLVQPIQTTAHGSEPGAISGAHVDRAIVLRGQMIGGAIRDK